MKKNPYSLKAEVIARKYAEFLVEFEAAGDDRRVAYNCIHQIIQACKAMEGQENNFICCAVNARIREQQEVIDRIVTRFTGKVYHDFHWMTPEEVEAEEGSK